MDIFSLILDTKSTAFDHHRNSEKITVIEDFWRHSDWPNMHSQTMNSSIMLSAKRLSKKKLSDIKKRE